LPSLPACRKAFARYVNCDEADIDWQKDHFGGDEETPF
jgi:hypothetical protein